MQKRGGLVSAATTQLEARHHASGLNSKFNGNQRPFAEYVSATRGMIRNIRSAGNHDSPDQDYLNKVVDGNAPFELEPSGDDVAGQIKKFRRGILLTHGLSDSPYFMRHLAAFFQASGFRVMAVLLPGHGTQPGDLLDTSWQEWASTVAYGTDQLAAEVDEVYLGGYSAGGALSIYQSLQDRRVRGLFLFSPALAITREAAYACLHKWVSWLIPRMQWVDIKPDKDIYKYESFAKNAATQMYLLTHALQARMKRNALNIPVFTVASADDKSVNISVMQEFMSRQVNALNKLIIYTTEISRFVRNTAEEQIEWVNSVIPEQKILSSAHTAILLPPTDRHYGIDGDYANCIHYYPDDMDKYNACILHPKECWLGEITEANLKAGTLRRLMYNPHYAALQDSLKRFIDRLPLFK